MDILIKPIVTEKMTALSERYNRYGFVVVKQANKIQIRKAVENMYGVSVKNIKTMNMPGKLRMRHTKSGVSKGVKASYKKAIVSLVEGETIDFYSNI